MPGMLKCHLSPHNYCQRYWSYCGHGPRNILAWIYSVGLHRGALMSATLSTFCFPIMLLSLDLEWLTAAFFLHPESPVSPLFPQDEHQKYLCWKLTIIYCMLQGLPGPMFTEVSRTYEYLSLFDSFCLLRFYTRKQEGWAIRAKKVGKRPRWNSRESWKLLTANLNNHLNVLTNEFKRDIWHLKMPNMTCLSTATCLVSWTCFQKMNANDWFWSQLPNPWNKNMVKSLSETKWSLDDRSHLRAINITLLHSGSTLAQVHFAEVWIMMWSQTVILYILVIIAPH